MSYKYKVFDSTYKSINARCDLCILMRFAIRIRPQSTSVSIQYAAPLRESGRVNVIYPVGPIHPS